MSTNKKKLKYEENKKIEQIEDVARYNEIGQEEGDSAGKNNSGYQLRKTDATNKGNAHNVRIDEKKLVTKKTITVPETKPDDTYYSLIENKREIMTQLLNQRGYKRIFQEDVLPDPDKYEYTDNDLKFLQKLNANLSHNQQVSTEDFEKIV